VYQLLLHDEWHAARQCFVPIRYLFCVYMREITIDVTSCGTCCQIGSTPACILMYADALVLLSPSWGAQQKLINVCAESVSRVDMMFNATKSTVMIFPPHRIARRALGTFPIFSLSGVALSVVDNCKYLCHIIYSVNDDNHDITRQINRPLLSG